ncbi:MAG TPA: hypothetical protein VK426_08665, partial [Methanobacterium sp.]|nr:hypothetical protein [Methanobacterium sp.]
MQLKKLFQNYINSLKINQITQITFILFILSIGLTLASFFLKDNWSNLTLNLGTVFLGAFLTLTIIESILK